MNIWKIICIKNLSHLEGTGRQKRKLLPTNSKQALITSYKYWPYLEIIPEKASNFRSNRENPWHGEIFITVSTATCPILVSTTSLAQDSQGRIGFYVFFRIQHFLWSRSKPSISSLFPLCIDFLEDHWYHHFFSLKFTHLQVHYLPGLQHFTLY